MLARARARGRPRPAPRERRAVGGAHGRRRARPARPTSSRSTPTTLLVPGALAALADALDAQPEATLAWGDVEILAATSPATSAARPPRPVADHVPERAPGRLARSGATRCSRPAAGSSLGYEDWDLWMSFAERRLETASTSRADADPLPAARPPHARLDCIPRHDELVRPAARAAPAALRRARRELARSRAPLRVAAARIPRSTRCRASRTYKHRAGSSSSPTRASSLRLRRRDAAPRGEPSPDDPRVTVLLAVQNGLPYVREAVESVLAQTFTDFELLVVDDASTDGTGEAVAAYADPRIRVLRNARQPRPGAVAEPRPARGARRVRRPHRRRRRCLPGRLERQVAVLDAEPEVAPGRHLDGPRRRRGPALGAAARPRSGDRVEFVLHTRSCSTATPGATPR